ncbi:MAG: BT_3928 family protein [Chitinophagaceae bacterium]
MMRLLHIFRWVTGLLFIFSGLVKANDPLGLSYKMDEFVEALHLAGFMHYSLAFSVAIITFEIIAGVALLLGWRMRLFSSLLLLLIIFFSFLTGYAVFSGKIAACGCFGDCIPLQPMQSFIKDLVLFVMIIFIFLKHKSIQPHVSNKVANMIMLASFVFTMGMQAYVLRYLPIIDCLPFKVGNNLLQQMQMPKDAMPDVFELRFVYKRNDTVQEFTANQLPDSTWTFVDRKQVLLKKGKNNQPPIRDFILRTASGNDTTSELLNTKGRYYLLFIQHFENHSSQEEWLRQAAEIAKKEKVFIVTGQPDQARVVFGYERNVWALPKILSCDVTAIKTAARAIPVMFAMEGPIVFNKWSGAHFYRIQNWLKTQP